MLRHFRGFHCARWRRQEDACSATSDYHYAYFGIINTRFLQVPNFQSKLGRPKQFCRGWRLCTKNVSRSDMLLIIVKHCILCCNKGTLTLYLYIYKYIYICIYIYINSQEKERITNCIRSTVFIFTSQQTNIMVDNPYAIYLPASFRIK